MDDFNISVTNRVELSMLIAAVLKVTATSIEGDSFLGEAAVGPKHPGIILTQVQLCVFLDNQTEVFDLPLDGCLLQGRGNLCAQIV